MPGLPLTTQRLRLEPWDDVYIEVVARLSSMPEVVRYIGDGGVWTPERVAESTARLRKHWEEHGFGWRVVIEKAGDEPVGFIGLNFIAEDTEGLDPTEHEIGWWLEPAVWGRGYAVEGATALRDEALGRLGAPYVVACIQPANSASISVAERLGLRHAGRGSRLGVQFDVYRGP